jgi:hypothetical protein
MERVLETSDIVSELKAIPRLCCSMLLDDSRTASQQKNPSDLLLLNGCVYRDGMRE